MSDNPFLKESEDFLRSVLKEELLQEHPGGKALPYSREIIRLAEIGKLQAGLVHDLNNQLAMGLGFVQILLKDPLLTPEQKECAAIINDTFHEASQLITSTLQMAQEDGPALKKTALNAVLEKSIQKIEIDPEFKAKGVTIQRNFEAALPDALLDPFQMHRLGTNLIRNAIHAIHENGHGNNIVVSTFFNQNRVHISIADNGPGIPKHILHRLTEPFFTTRKEKGGSGLGLMIVNGIVKAHGGNLSIQNIPQSGAMFMVTLPFRNASV